MEISDEGHLRTPQDEHGENHVLGYMSFPTREEAIEYYANFVNESRNSCPFRLYLIEEHSMEINWDE